MNSIHNFWSPGGVLAMAVGDQMNMFDQSYPQTKQTCMTCFMLDESVSNSLNKHSNKAIHAQIGLFKRQLDHTGLIVYGTSKGLFYLVQINCSRSTRLRKIRICVFYFGPGATVTSWLSKQFALRPTRSNQKNLLVARRHLAIISG